MFLEQFQDLYQLQGEEFITLGVGSKVIPEINKSILGSSLRARCAQARVEEGQQPVLDGSQHEIDPVQIFPKQRPNPLGSPYVHARPTTAEKQLCLRTNTRRVASGRAWRQDLHGVQTSRNACQ